MDRSGRTLFSRRDFLKFSAGGMLGVFFSELGIDTTIAAPAIRQGRATLSGIEVYEEPSSKTRLLRLLGRDQILDIRGVMEGELGPGNPYNNLWYQLEDGGYAYSGWIQPVETQYRLPDFTIPAGGQLGDDTHTQFIDRPLVLSATAGMMLVIQAGQADRNRLPSLYGFPSGQSRSCWPPDR